MTDVLYRFGVAIGIGFLMGLQREFASGKGEAERVRSAWRTPVVPSRWLPWPIPL